jgi:hypothetical protein
VENDCVGVTVGGARPGGAFPGAADKSEANASSSDKEDWLGCNDEAMFVLAGKEVTGEVVPGAPEAAATTGVGLNPVGTNDLAVARISPVELSL